MKINYTLFLSLTLIKEAQKPTSRTLQTTLVFGLRFCNFQTTPLDNGACAQPLLIAV